VQAHGGMVPIECFSHCFTQYTRSRHWKRSGSARAPR
jgi:hypothetical protein